MQAKHGEATQEHSFMISNKELHEQIFANNIVKSLLDQIENPKEKEKTVRAIEGMLEQLQGKANGLAQAYEEIAKKQRSE